MASFKLPVIQHKITSKDVYVYWKYNSKGIYTIHRYVKDTPQKITYTNNTFQCEDLNQ